ncbi:hypothetical protein ADUPG1_009986 [Aduncisulcus paluster]|uniref:Uncharacterized protein n=1 Tax=Aduncisulcus paluster TaxID=2918883 RepID=A0ABQ5KYM0_9EUKA|nr:hypothetical protein ADUPG1_009986 [Aduncisulcus paluster]
MGDDKLFDFMLSKNENLIDSVDSFIDTKIFVEKERQSIKPSEDSIIDLFTRIYMSSPAHQVSQAASKLSTIIGRPSQSHIPPIDFSSEIPHPIHCQPFVSLQPESPKESHTPLLKPVFQSTFEPSQKDISREAIPPYGQGLEPNQDLVLDNGEFGNVSFDGGSLDATSVKNPFEIDKEYISPENPIQKSTKDNDIKEIETEAFGTTDDAFGTTDDAFGTTDDAFGTTDDAFGTTDDAFGTTDDAFGTTDDAFGTTDDAFGTTDDAFGTTDDAFGTTEEFS